MALIFTAVGIFAGMKLTRPKEIEVEVIREVEVRVGGPFVMNAGKVRELGLTPPREHEILGLIAEGLSNREMPNGCSSRRTQSRPIPPALRGVNRRTQAVLGGKELGLIP